MEVLGHVYTVIHGSASRMDLLSNNQVDLVLTSPPYFCKEIEARLSLPRKDQKNENMVFRDIYSFATALRPCFEEIYRVLKPGRAFVIQTKDIRYGNILIPLSDHHLSIAMSCGFNLISRFNWVPFQSSFKRMPGILTKKKVGQFRVSTGETFLILAKGLSLDCRDSLDSANMNISSLISPLWRMPFRRKKDDHPHVSPRPVIKNIISLLSHEDDLVVDPFAGYGTIIEVSRSLKRLAIGWEIDQECVNEALKRLR